MNRKITRGLALVAITGGFTLLGVTAANAIDIGGDDDDLLGVDIDLGDSTGHGLLGRLDGPTTANVPVKVNGLNVAVLPHQGAPLAGKGVLVAANSAAASPFAAISSQRGVGTVLAAPVDASGSWLSVFSNRANGVVLVPVATADPSGTLTDDFVGPFDAFAEAPVDVSCSSVTVFSDYASDCAGDGGTGNGGADGSGGNVIVDPTTGSDGIIEGGATGSVTIECLRLIVLTVNEAACAAEPGGPTDPTDPTDPDGVGGGDNGGANDNGGNGGANGGNANGDDACVVNETTLEAGLATDTTSASTIGMLAAAALIGGLAAAGLITARRKLHIL